MIIGIITTVKRKQEFRIRLQSRARRRVEKLLEEADDERQRQTVSVLTATVTQLFRQRTSLTRSQPAKSVFRIVCISTLLADCQT